jgi:tellurite resistance protein
MPSASAALTSPVLNGAPEAIATGRLRGCADNASLGSWRRRVSAGSRSPSTRSDLAKRLASLDAELLEALATASAFIAAGDGDETARKRDEFIRFVDRQGFVAESSRCDLGAAFDRALNRLKSAGNASAILHRTMRPLAGLSLASLVVRTAERVAAVERRVQFNHLRALMALRSILIESTDQGNARPIGVFAHNNTKV